MHLRPNVLVGTVVAMLVTACSSSSPEPSTATSPSLGAATTATTVTGTVSAFSGTCPRVGFALERRTISTDAATVFRDGSCAGLKNGVRVEAGGTAGAEGSMLATTIRLIPSSTTPEAPPAPVPPAPTPTIVSATGTINNLSGACPMVSFVFETRVIRTDASTAYADATCSTLKNALRAEISGIVQGDGSILALKVHALPVSTTPVPTPTPAPPPATTISGTVSAVSGTCPSLKLGVGERTATTNGDTKFDGQGCGDIKVGTAVEITGTTSSAGVFVATKVVSRTR